MLITLLIILPIAFLALLITAWEIGSKASDGDYRFLFFWFLAGILAVSWLGISLFALWKVG